MSSYFDGVQKLKSIYEEISDMEKTYDGCRTEVEDNISYIALCDEMDDLWDSLRDEFGVTDDELYMDVYGEAHDETEINL